MKGFYLRAISGASALIASAALSFGHAPAAEGASQNFYSGKTVRVIVGYAPGGGYDFYARTVARYMGKYVPRRSRDAACRALNPLNIFPRDLISQRGASLSPRGKPAKNSQDRSSAT